MTGGNEQATPRKPVNTSDRSFTGRSSRAALKPLLEAVVHAAVDDVLNESASSQEELSPRFALIVFSDGVFRRTSCIVRHIFLILKKLLKTGVKLDGIQKDSLSFC